SLAPLERQRRAGKGLVKRRSAHYMPLRPLTGYRQSKTPPRRSAIKKAAQRAAEANLYRLSSHSSQMKHGKDKADGAPARAGDAEAVAAGAPKLGKTEKSDSERRADSCHGVSRYCTLRPRNI